MLLLLPYLYTTVLLLLTKTIKNKIQILGKKTMQKVKKNCIEFKLNTIN